MDLKRKFSPANAICPVCSNSNTISFEAVSRKYSLIQCAVCTHVHFKPSKDGKINNINQHFEGTSYAKWRKENNNLIRKRTKKQMKFLSSKLLQSLGNVLEIGCSSGEMLHEFQQINWTPYGVDLSSQSILLAKESFPTIDFRIGTEEMFMPSPPTYKFNLFLAYHVVEHIADINTLLKNLRSLSSQDAIICIYVPNWNAWSRKMMQDEWPDIMEEHLQYFTQESLHKWLEIGGFKVIHEETGGKAWLWIGGLKRKCYKLFKIRQNDDQDEKKPMPNRTKMVILRAFHLLLYPLLKLEGLVGCGGELRIIAKLR